MMFAIIKSGGRQLRVEPGSVVSVDHRTETEGQAVTFDDVLFVSDDDGSRGIDLLRRSRQYGRPAGPDFASADLSGR